jgi:hypothetical protein
VETGDVRSGASSATRPIRSDLKMRVGGCEASFDRQTKLPRLSVETISRFRRFS